MTQTQEAAQTYTFFDGPAKGMTLPFGEPPKLIYFERGDGKRACFYWACRAPTLAVEYALDAAGRVFRVTTPSSV